MLSYRRAVFSLSEMPEYPCRYHNVHISLGIKILLIAAIATKLVLYKTLLNQPTALFPNNFRFLHLQPLLLDFYSI